jgi:hypothetical protein
MDKELEPGATDHKQHTLPDMFTTDKHSAQTCGVPLELFFGMTEALCTSIDFMPPQLKKHMIVLNVPIKLADKIALGARGSHFNNAYETRGVVTHTGTVNPVRHLAWLKQCKKDGTDGSFAMKKEHLARVLNLVRDHCATHELSMTSKLLDDVKMLDQSLFWKRAKGHCNIQSGSLTNPITLIFFWSHTDQTGVWFNVSHSHDPTQRHCFDLEPQPAEVEGVTPLTGKEHKRARQRKNRKDNQPGGKIKQKSG